MFITGPQVIKQVTGEQITAEALGGADAHMALSGVIHFIAEDDEQAVLHLPRSCSASCRQNNLEDPPRRRCRQQRRPRPRAERRSCPSRPSKGYDVRDVIGADRRPRRLPGGAGRLRHEHRRRLRPDHRPHDRHHRQPARVLAGRARHQRLRQGDRASSASATRSTSRWSRSSTSRASCRASQQEHGGIIRHGAKMLFAYSAATVPKITGDPPQGLRRGVPGDVLQGPGRRPRLRLADRRDRRDGRRGGRRDRLPQGDRRRRRTRSAAAPS